MIYSLTGEAVSGGEGFFVIQVGGIGFKIFSPEKLCRSIAPGLRAIYCHLHVREDALDLFGFNSPAELKLFELLISVSGVGPRSALAIMDVAELDDLKAAIQEGRADLLTRASGIGRKTAERIIIDLRQKVRAEGAEGTVARMETDSDLVETLTTLGYRQDQVRAALEKVGSGIAGIENRLRAALKILGGRK